MLLLTAETKAGIVEAGMGLGRRGSHGHRTWNNRINHIKNVTATQIDSFSFRIKMGLKIKKENLIQFFSAM